MHRDEQKPCWDGEHHPRWGVATGKFSNSRSIRSESPISGRQSLCHGTILTLGIISKVCYLTCLSWKHLPCIRMTAHPDRSSSPVQRASPKDHMDTSWMRVLWSVLAANGYLRVFAKIFNLTFHFPAKIGGFLFEKRWSGHETQW